MLSLSLPLPSSLGFPLPLSLPPPPLFLSCVLPLPLFASLCLGSPSSLLCFVFLLVFPPCVSFLPAASFRLLLSGALVSICRPGWFARCERLLLGLLLVLRCAPCGPLYLSGCVSTSSGFHVSLRHGDLLFFFFPRFSCFAFCTFVPVLLSSLFAFPVAVWTSSALLAWFA